MQLSIEARSPRRLSVASIAIVSLLVALMAFAPAVAAADEGSVLAADSKALILGDIAASELNGGLVNMLGVVWQNRGVSYLRWSSEDPGDGMTFEPAVALRGGFKAKDPRIAACNDYLYATSVWNTPTGEKIGIDWMAPMSGPHAQGRYVLAPGNRPDIACLNGLVAVTYMSGELAQLAIFDGESCGNPCVPMFHYNLGAGGFFGRATVAATDRGFVVSWMGPGIYVQRFVLTSSGVSVKPLLSVGQDSWYPQIASDGTRVVIAYGRRGQTHMRISENRGATFGPRIIVSKFCLECPDGGSSPDSVDVRDGRIMVHVGQGGGIPTAIDQFRFLTKNDGKKWTKTSAGHGGDSFGILLEYVLAEVWDNHVYADSIYGSQPQEIRFRAPDLN